MKKVFLLVFTIIICFAATSCKKNTNFESYVSDYRYNILEGQEQDYKIRINQFVRESPYKIDGIKQPTVELIEFILTAPDNTLNYIISYDINDSRIEGQLNYNSARKRFELILPCAKVQLETLDIKLSFEQSNVHLVATSLVPQDIAPLNDILNSLYELSPEHFNALTTQSGFEGEIHARLLAENQSCYYFIGLIDRNGKIYAFLINATTKQIIAKKQINYRTNIALPV